MHTYRMTIINVTDSISYSKEIAQASSVSTAAKFDMLLIALSEVNALDVCKTQSQKAEM